MTKKLVTNKLKISAIPIILLLTISTLLVTFPITTAQSEPWKQTYAFINALPNPVGVGQEVLLHVGITDSLGSTALGWENITVTIEKPDGNIDTLGPIKTDATGGTGATYTPTQAGTYILQTHFPEQIAPMALITSLPPGTRMLASDSEELELTVTDIQIDYYPDIALPNEYWTRPIDAQARSWSSISGNWLTAARPIFSVPFNDYAPESAHILWTKQLQIGGLAGGERGPHAFEEGDAYEGLWGDGAGNQGPVIIAGVLYYNQYKSEGGTDVEQEVVAVDLHTGEELWTRNWNSARLSFGQVFYYDSYNYHAVFPYLWSVIGSTWNAYNPTTGRWEYTMTNVPPGTNIYGANGEIYRYTVNTTAGWMTLWNSSGVIPDVGSWGSQVLGKTLDATEGIEWNVTIPTDLPGPPGFVAAFGSVNVISYENVLVGSDMGIGITLASDAVHYWGLSVKPGEEGQLLFNKAWQLPSANLTMGITAVSEEDGVFILAAKEIRQFWGFSIETGDQLWGPTESQIYLDAYQITAASQGPDTSWWAGGSVATADGILYSASIGGIVYAYDVTSGEPLWTYEASDPYNEILWNNNWPMRVLFITDGKLYVGHDEHSPIDPKPRGAPFICLNATTGEEIFRANGLFRQTEAGSRAIIGDSIIATVDSYDERIYAIGKGPSETTVTINNNVVSQGSSILLEGTVMDISPGTTDAALQLRFPKGVPAMSDESMTAWMLYVYKQFACPADVKGVDVFIKIQDPNGDYYSTTVTTDGSGAFSMAWAPQIVGMYQVTVLFQGSNSYYSSWATKSFVVDATPAAPSYNGPTAEEIAAESASRTIAMMPQFPYVPTAEEIAADAAQRTINMLPQYPDTTCPEIPAYQTIDIVIIILVVVVLIIGLYCCIFKKK